MANQLATATGERRLELRYPASAVPGITSVRLSPGDGVELVDLSRSGALVEGRMRIVPGTRVTVIIEGDGKPVQVRGRVVRCHVSSLNRRGLLYRSGIEFYKPLDCEPVDLVFGGESPVTTDDAPRPTIARAPIVTDGQSLNRW